MTTEDDFHTALDANPEDWQTRLVFADWLQERNDPRADGYRALGTNRLHPLKDLRAHVDNNWYFQSGKSGVLTDHPKIASAVNLLPQDWIDAVRYGGFNRSDNDLWVGYSTSRREVEDAVARAFAALPPERRAKLLAGTGLAPKKRPRKRKRDT